MSSYIAFLVLGLGSGAIYAVIALGLVLQLRGSNVLNFGFAAMMMIGTLVYSSLRSSGTLVLPVPGLPVFHIANGGANAWTAGACATAVVLVIALLAHYVVFKWLRNAPAISRVGAAVGTMLTLEAVAGIRFSNPVPPPSGLLPNSVITVLGARVPEDRLLLAGVAVVLGLGMWAFFKYTTIGLAIRGSAESEQGAAILGWSPDRLALFTWIGAGVLAAAMGILIAPIATSDVITYSLLIIPALGAALVARFKSFSVCVVSGLGLGMIGSVTTKAAADFTWLPQIGIQDGVALVFIIAIMVIGGQMLPGRGMAANLRYPIAYAPRNVTRRSVVLIGAAVVGIIATHGAARFALIDSMIGVVLALSIVIVTGFAGQISLAQYAFAGIAGFTLSKLGSNAGIPFPIAPVLASLFAAFVGVLIGLPAVRVRGINLAIVTLACAEAVDTLVFENPHVSGGYNGALIRQPKLFGWNLGITAGHGQASIAFAVLCLVVAGAACLATSNLRRSSTGRRMLAVRANERAAAAVGINVPQVKLLAFGLSAFIAGIGGSLLAYEQLGGNLTSDAYGPIASLVLLTAVFIGGVSTVAGAIVAGVGSVNGIANYLLASNIRDYVQWEALIGGLGLVVVAVKQPDGVAGFNIAMVRELKASWQIRRAAAQIVDAPKSQRPTTPAPSALKASRDTTAVGSE
jgi:branched-chain amino acid transport system permease protein